MIRIRVVALALLCGLGPLIGSIPAHAHESNGTPAAKTFFAEGDAAAKAGKPGEAAAAFRKAIDADPDFAEAHQRFIESTRWEQMPGSRTPTVPHLQDLYEQWATQHPTRAVYTWALGFLLHDPAKANVLFKQAIAIDPAFARAHFHLARNADLRGDWVAQRQHLKAAVETNPDNPQYLVRYAHAHKNSDRARFRELALSVVEKFPESGAAAEALYNLAAESSHGERRRYLEQLRAKYPPDRFGYASMAMGTLYSELTKPADALALAKEMVKALPSSKSWSQRVAHQEAMVRVEALIAERKFTDALDAIAKTQKPSGSHGTTWVLLKADAGAGAGQPHQAYSTLVESVAAEPNDRVIAALNKYGPALKKTPREVDADVWRIRDSAATPAPPFELARAGQRQTVRLSDYRGRVVLLAFWFPG